jgi:hypothetical protein
MTTLKTRIQQLESRRAQTTRAKKEYPEECICFPDADDRNSSDQVPCFGFEADAAAKVQCPVHGARFKRLSRAIYRSPQIWRREWAGGFRGMSHQYEKAVRATFGDPQEIPKELGGLFKEK